GEGHSSLRHLRELPFDRLKIDRSFVQAMNEDRDAAIMVRTIAAMAQNLGLGVVVEGVRTEDQAKSLAFFGCELGQGELYGLAAPASQFNKLQPQQKRLAASKPAPATANLPMVIAAPAPEAKAEEPKAAPKKLESAA